MPGRYAVLLCLLLTAPVRAEVFTWTDAAGVRHYGDRPPAATTAETLELERQTLSTIGDSGIRPGERALLERAEAMETARLQAAAARAAARAAQSPTVRSEVAPPPPERRIVTYRLPPYWAYHKPRKRHWRFDLRLGRLSFHAGSLHAGRSIGGPPRRPDHHRPDHRRPDYRSPTTHRTVPNRARHPGATLPIQAPLRPPTR